jgi:hypothetical protein
VVAIIGLEQHMFTLQQADDRAGKFRLVAHDQLDADDFREVAERVSQVPLAARKVGLVAARKAERKQRIETRWNGKESEITAESGDWIVTSLSPRGDVVFDSEGHPNTYAITPGRFAELYEPSTGKTEFGAKFRAKGVVAAIRLPGGFEIEAPWGETQRSADGYLVLNGAEVYGNARETFEATYEPVG